MTSRERVLAAMDFAPVDRLPTDYWATGETTRKLLSHFGVEEATELWDRLGIDKILGVRPRYVGPAYEEPSPGTNPFGYWGVRTAPVAYEGGVYYEISHSPLREFTSIDEIEAGYTWPRADWFDFSEIAEACRRHPDYAVEAGYVAPLYMYQNIRGVDLALMDFAAEPELADYVLERICTFLYEYNTRLFDAADGAIDITQVTDDFGMQSGLMISPQTFDRFFASRMKGFIDLAHQAGIRVFHHDDGAIMDLIPRLVDLGIDVLNPIQWRLPGMSLEALARRFGPGAAASDGRRIAFHGGIDNQEVLPFGSEADVRLEVERCVETLGADGTGYVIAPCHNIQPNTPVENVIAMYDAARDAGRT